MTLADGQTLLAAGGAIWVPSAVRGDAFSFRTPTGAARYYLTTAASLDQAISAFDVAYAQWGQLSDDNRRLAAMTLSDAYDADVLRMQQFSWPGSSTHDASLVAQQSTRLPDDLAAWIASGLALGNPQYARYAIDANQVHESAIRLRASLGLPPP